MMQYRNWYISSRTETIFLVIISFGILWFNPHAWTMSCSGMLAGIIMALYNLEYAHKFALGMSIALCFVLLVLGLTLFIGFLLGYKVPLLLGGVIKLEKHKNKIIGQLEAFHEEVTSNRMNGTEKHKLFTTTFFSLLRSMMTYGQSCLALHADNIIEEVGLEGYNECLSKSIGYKK